MSSGRLRRAGGFTLIELLAALLVLTLLAVMAYRGLGVVMTSRDRIETESAQWRQTQAFFTRFARDVGRAAPRPVRSAGGDAPAWLGRPGTGQAPSLEFSRFGGDGDAGTPVRIGYGLNATHQVELWIWPGLDLAAGTPAVRYVVLDNVLRFDLEYLDPALAWRSAWPTVPSDPLLPLAVRLQVEFGSGETVTRIFALHT